MEALKQQVGGTHYTSLAIQPAEYILGNELGKYEGDIVKYVTRWKNKGGIEDLKKIQQCCDILIEFYEPKNDHDKVLAQAKAAEKKARQDAQQIEGKR
tara:strand:- start:105 stop:398 length:294 start_codon:yes stop_codon:yes gene_type:complete